MSLCHSYRTNRNIERAVLLAQELLNIDADKVHWLLRRLYDVWPSGTNSEDLRKEIEDGVLRKGFYGLVQILCDTGKIIGITPNNRLVLNGQTASYLEENKLVKTK